MRPTFDGDVWVGYSCGGELAKCAEVERVVRTDACPTATLKQVLELLKDGILEFELASISYIDRQVGRAHDIPAR